MSKDAVLDELPRGSFLFPASGQDGPNPCRPLASPLRAGALSDLAVNDHSPQRLLSQVVGGGNGGIGQEAQIRTPMFVQAMGYVLRFARQLSLRNKHSQVSLEERKAPLVLSRRHGAAQVPEVKEAFELTQKPFAKLLIGLVREDGQEFDVPDQMGQAELMKGTRVFGVGREEIRDECALKGFAQNLLEDLRAPAGFHGEKAKEIRTKGPDPEGLAPVFVTRFIDMQMGLAGNGFFQFLIRRAQRLTDRANLIREHGA